MSVLRNPSHNPIKPAKQLYLTEPPNQTQKHRAFRVSMLGTVMIFWVGTWNLRYLDIEDIMFGTGASKDLAGPL